MCSKIIKRFQKLRLLNATILGFVLVLFCLEPVCGHANNIKTDSENTEVTYTSCTWKTAINLPPEKKPDIYPEKRKITSKTIQRTVNEYIPQLSGFVNKGVDCFEWVNTLDDPYLNKYKLDMEIDAQDERLKLIWKDKF